jgi:ABC-type lipoprotein release transport system permease subunit
MKKRINFYLLEYALKAILRNKLKNSFILFIFTLLIFILSSMFFITNSIKFELNLGVDSLPQIIVQQLNGGRIANIDSSKVDEILTITGVKNANARVWGYYYFANAGVNFTLVGIDSYETQYKGLYKKLVETNSLEDGMIVGVGVKNLMSKYYYNDYFNFIKNDGEFKKLHITGVFDSDISLESNDIIVISKDDAHKILGLGFEKATDIVVTIANPEEIETIKDKILTLFPDTRVLTKNDLQVSYQNIFDYKSGVFLALFCIAIFTFFMIVFDKATGITSNEKKEIGILKSIGWSIDDILKEKFYESFIISFLAYLLGVTLALFFVYILQAPLLKEIFMGYSQLKPKFVLPFIIDFQTLFLVFFLSVPVYVLSTIIPSWKIATLDAWEVIR